MVNIDFKDLDKGYTQISEISTHVKTKGTELLNKIDQNIGNLKVHWIGTDASKHINNLIDMYSSLGQLLTIATTLTSATADNIIAVQKVRFANNQSGMVGSELTKQGPNVASISKMPDTERYYCDPAAANDLSTLIEIYNNYTTFANTFEQNTNELMNNWIDGANRAQVNSAFSKFISESKEYKQHLANAKSNLETAVSNINKIQ